MKYGSVCSGIEGASEAWHGLGWEPSFFSEIEEFPRAVLKHHHPDTPVHGDFTTINKGDYDDIQVLIGGTPCQAFSIAGLRNGLTDARGNLALEFIKLAYRLQPEIVVWENVPGVFSSNGGEDFRSFLSAFAGWDVPLPEDGWRNSGVISAAPGCYALAWRVCDSQFHGVPQRRRRVFVVATSSGDWRGSASILFDTASMRWDLAPRKKTRKDITGDAGSGFNFSSDGGAGESGGLFDSPAGLGGEGSDQGSEAERGGSRLGSDGAVLDNGSHWDDEQNPHPTLNQANAGSGSPGYSNQEIFSQRGGGLVPEGQHVFTGMDDNEVSQTISWREYKGLSCGRDGLTSPAVVEEGPVPYSIMPMNSGKDYKAREVEVSQPVLTQPMGGNQGGDFIVDPMPFDETQITHPENRSKPMPGDPAGTLSADARPPTIAFQSNANACDAAAAGIDVSPTVRVGSGLEERGDPPAVAYPIHDQATRHAGKRGENQDGKGNGLGVGQDGDPSPTLTAGDNHAVAYPIDSRNAGRDPEKHDEMNRQGVGVGEDGDPAHTVTSAFTPGVATPMAVRRLTPDECEALQGFPRGHTEIPYKGKAAEDCPAGPRYKAIGNSFAVPVIAWIGDRIQMHADMHENNNGRSK